MHISDWSSDVCSSDLCGQIERVEQIVGRSEDLIDREHLRKARGFSADLTVEARVLRVEHVEQRAAADRKLLAIGGQQLVGRLALVDQVAEHRGLRLTAGPRAARIGLAIASGFVAAETALAPAAH